MECQPDIAEFQLQCVPYMDSSDVCVYHTILYHTNYTISYYTALHWYSPLSILLSCGLVQYNIITTQRLPANLIHHCFSCSIYGIHRGMIVCMCMYTIHRECDCIDSQLSYISHYTTAVCSFIKVSYPSV